MKKLIALGFVLIIPTACFAYSTAVHVATTNSIMMMGAAVRTSQAKQVKTKQEKIEECIKFGGGQACYTKYKSNKTS